MQNRVHGNDHHIVNRNDGKGREPYGKNAAHDAQVVAAEGNGNRRFFTEQEDKNRIQQNVGDRAGDNRKHGNLGIALTDDKLVHPSRQQGEQRSKQINGEILIGKGHCGFTGPKK